MVELLGICYDKCFQRLKESGWTTYTNRTNRLLAQDTIRAMRAGKPISTAIIDRLCGVLRCQPGELMEYMREEEETSV